MSEPLVRRRPMIDLEEFERRLRKPLALGPGDNDPLAELARFVGDQDSSRREDPYEAMFELPGRRVSPKARNGRDHDERIERCVPEPLIRGDFASIEAGLLGMETSEDDPSSSIMLDHSGHADEHARSRFAGEEDGGGDSLADEEVRSWRPLYIMAAMIVAGVAGIFASFAFKGAVSSPDEIATIKAAEGPVKVQPDAIPASEPAGQDATILGGAPQQAPVAAATDVEQPPDLSAPMEIPGGNQGAPSESVSGGGVAASVPVPPPPAQAQSPAPAGPRSIADLIEPKKVRTVAVRPDGTLLPNDAPPQSVSPAMQAAGPIGAPAAKAAAPKTAARVATAPKPAADSADSSPQTTVAPKAKPAAASGRTFAIQLAAPASEQEARDLQARLMQKFAADLAGFQPSIRKAEVGGKEVYRVRFIGTSRDQATALCQKVQSSGGSCFVAKN